MKYFGMIFFVFMSSLATSQTNTFPENWIGNWKGELLWYKTGKTDPQKVDMELRIHPTDSGGNFTWHIIYGSPTEDSRPYVLIPVDSASGHWVIDELSGIKLDQFWIGNKFSGAFSVQNSTIVNSYWLDNDKLNVEFFSYGAKSMTRTGKGTEDVPYVDSYKMGSYQKAVLLRSK